MAALPAKLAAGAVVAAAPEEAVEMDLAEVEAAEVAPSSMVQADSTTRVVPADSFVVVQAATSRAMATVALVPAAAVVEEEKTVGAWGAEDLTEPMAPTAAAAVEAEATSITHREAAVVATAVLAGAVAAQGRSGLSSVAVMEGMVDMAAAQASEWAPTLICTANLETRPLSEEVVTAVAAAVEAEVSEAPSSMRVVRFSSATARSPITTWTGARAESLNTERTERAMARMPARRSSR